MHLGALEIGLIVAAAVLIFGSGKIADLGKGMGKAIGNFKRELRASKDEEEGTTQLLASKSNYCSECGESLRINANFCLGCGTKLTDEVKNARHSDLQV
jgi:sec-independent protein translocase protein TatA